MQFAAVSTISFIIVLFILYCSQWDKIAIQVSQNTNLTSNTIGQVELNPGTVLMRKIIINSKQVVSKIVTVNSPMKDHCFNDQDSYPLIIKIQDFN